MSWDDKKIEEAVKCALDVEYFVDTFVWMDADEAIIPFNLGKKEGEDFWYQREILRKFKNGENIVVLKSRRAGLSWIAAAICAWGITFNKGWNALLVSRSEKEAVSLLRKVAFILDNLAYKDAPTIGEATPASWLRPETIPPTNMRNITVAHRNSEGDITATSMVSSLTTTKHSGRGEKSKFVFIDEVAFIENQDEIFGSVITTAARAGQWMMGSNASDVGTRFHFLCMRGRAKENKNYWYREVWPEETGIDQDMIEAASETMTDDQKMSEWYLTFKQSGDAVFNQTHLAACYKPPEMFPEVNDILNQYREKVRFGQGGYYYYSGIDSAVGKTHRKSREKDYNCFTALTMEGVQAFAYFDKKPLSTWAGGDVKDIDGNLISAPGKTSELHKMYPGLCVIEEEGPGQVVISRHQLPEDGFSDYIAMPMKHHIKNRLIKNLIIAVESHSIIITDEKTYQQLSMYQYGDTPDTYEAPVGFHDDGVMALALAWEAMMREGGSTWTYPKTPEELDMSPFSQERELDMQIAAIAPVVVTVPGIRASSYMPMPFKDLPDLPDERFLPDAGLVEELWNDRRKN